MAELLHFCQRQMETKMYCKALLTEEANATTKRNPLMTGMTWLASTLRHSTEQRIPPLSQGRPYLLSKPLSCQKETSSLSVCLL